MCTGDRRKDSIQHAANERRWPVFALFTALLAACQSVSAASFRPDGNGIAATAPRSALPNVSTIRTASCNHQPLDTSNDPAPFTIRVQGRLRQLHKIAKLSFLSRCAANPDYRGEICLRNTFSVLNCGTYHAFALSNF